MITVLVNGVPPIMPCTKEVESVQPTVEVEKIDVRAVVQPTGASLVAVGVEATYIKAVGVEEIDVEAVEQPTAAATALVADLAAATAAVAVKVAF